jgi:drug/metabolite transporter (DMT)-like permease
MLVGTLVAMSWVVAKFADNAGAPPLTFLTACLFGAGAVLLVVAVLQRQPMMLTRRTLEYAAVSGLFFAMPNALGFLAIPHVGAGFISLSLAFPILITWVLAVFMKLERLKAQRLAGVLVGLTGGVLLTASKATSASEGQMWALLVLAMPVIIAGGNMYRTLRWPAKAAPVFLAALMMFGGALALLPFVVFFEPGQATALFDTGAVARMLVLETAVFSVLYLFYFVLQKVAGPVYFSQIGTVAALVGTLVAVFMLGEAPPPMLGLAGALVITGTIIFHRGGRNA